MTEDQKRIAATYKAQWYAGVVANCRVRKAVMQSVILSAADIFSRHDGFDRTMFLDLCFGNHYPEGVK